MVDTGGDLRSPTLRIWACILVPAALALLLLWPVVKSPAAWLWPAGADHSDLAVSHWPNALFTRKTIWEQRRFPLWRPTILSGAPFAANPLSGLCYPPNWLLLFGPWLSLTIGFNISAVAHLWVAGVAMCGLMRFGFRSGTWGALAAAAAYQASPKLLAHLAAGHVGWCQAMAWLPLIVLCWLRAIRLAGDGGQGIRPCRWAMAAGAVAALQFCADARAAVYSLAAVASLTAVWGVARLRGSRNRGAGPAGRVATARSARGWVTVGACGLTALVGLSACQWVPLVALLPHVTRSSMTLQDAAVWSLPYRYLVGLLVADHSGFHEWMTYLGVSALVLASIGVRALWHRREERWLFWWLLAIMIGGVWFSLGDNGGLFNLLGSVLPGLGLLRVPARAWALVTFAAAVLAGLGVDRVAGHTWPAPCIRRRVQLALMVLSAFAVLLVVGYWVAVGQPQLALMCFGIVTPLTAAVCLMARRTRMRRWVGLAAVCLVVADLGVVDSTLVRTRSQEEVFADGGAAAEWLSAQEGDFRVYSPSYSIPQHVAELYGLRLADGVDPMQLEVYADYLAQAAGVKRGRYSVTLPPFADGSDVRTALQGVVPDAEMLGLLGVLYTAAAFPISDPDWEAVGEFDGVHVYENLRYQAVPPVDHTGMISLADGTILFVYDATPVYVGWAVSALTAACLLTGALLTRSARGGRGD
jgi:hypothetical protein